MDRILEFRSSGAGDGRAATTPIAIFNFTGSNEELASYLRLGCHIVMTGGYEGERGGGSAKGEGLLPPRLRQSTVVSVFSEAGGRVGHHVNRLPLPSFKYFTSHIPTQGVPMVTHPVGLGISLSFKHSLCVCP